MRIRETLFARLILWSHLFGSLCLSQFPPFIEENPQEVRLSFLEMSKQGLWELEWILWGFTVLSGGVNTPARVCLAAVETLTTFHTFKTLEKQAGVKCAAHTSYLASRFLYQGVFKYSSLQIGQDLKMKILVPVSKENINSITVYFLREVKRFLWSNCILLWSVETWCLSMSMCILFPVCTCVNSIVKYNLCSLGWEETSFFSW